MITAGEAQAFVAMARARRTQAEACRLETPVPQPEHKRRERFRKLDARLRLAWAQLLEHRRLVGRNARCLRHGFQSATHEVPAYDRRFVRDRDAMGARMRSVFARASSALGEMAHIGDRRVAEDLAGAAAVLPAVGALTLAALARGGPGRSHDVARQGAYGARCPSESPGTWAQGRGTPTRWQPRSYRRSRRSPPRPGRTPRARGQD